jgi:ATP-dependent Clp protease ATP-binding subunit ClpB
MKISFVLLDGIEKASDALWNLLLGILDKGTLTLGDNRKVDLSRAMIFMTQQSGCYRNERIGKP